MYKRQAGVEGTTKEEFDYDGIGRMTLARNWEGKTLITESTYKYNTLSLIDEETQKVGVYPAATIKRKFDGEGRMIEISYPSGRVITYNHDDAGRINSIVEGATKICAYAYAGRRIASRSYANGTKTLMSYDAVRRVVDINHLDPAGNSMDRYRYDE